MSRYISSRFYLHNPPGDRDSLHEREDAPAALRAEVEKMQKEKPVVNPWVCMIMLVTTVVLLGVTSEFVGGYFESSKHFILSPSASWYLVYTQCDICLVSRKSEHRRRSISSLLMLVF